MPGNFSAADKLNEKLEKMYMTCIDCRGVHMLGAKSLHYTSLLVIGYLPYRYGLFI